MRSVGVRHPLAALGGLGGVSLVAALRAREGGLKAAPGLTLGAR
jgi:hypothetical protein